MSLFFIDLVDFLLLDNGLVGGKWKKKSGDRWAVIIEFPGNTGIYMTFTYT